MQNAKEKRFPMDTKCHLELNRDGMDVDQKLCRSMIGSLLYLCASRPDIVLSVGVCARYQAAPKDATWWRSIESFDIWFIPQGLVYGIQRALISLLPGTRIRIGPVARMIGNQLPGHANFLVGPW